MAAQSDPASFTTARYARLRRGRLTGALGEKCFCRADAINNIMQIKLKNILPNKLFHPGGEKCIDRWLVNK
jgi:hypothetical protein